MSDAPTPPVQTQETLSRLLSAEWFAGRLDVDDHIGLFTRVAAAVRRLGWVSPADHARALTEAWDQGWASGTMYGYDEQRYPNPFRKGDADD